MFFELRKHRQWFSNVFQRWTHCIEGSGLGGSKPGGPSPGRLTVFGNLFCSCSVPLVIMVKDGHGCLEATLDVQSHDPWVGFPSNWTINISPVAPVLSCCLHVLFAIQLKTYTVVKLYSLLQLPLVCIAYFMLKKLYGCELSWGDLKAFLAIPISKWCVRSSTSPW